MVPPATCFEEWTGGVVITCMIAGAWPPGISRTDATATRAVMGLRRLPGVVDDGADGDRPKQHASRKDKGQNPAPVTHTYGGENERHNRTSCLIGGTSERETATHVGLHIGTETVRPFGIGDTDYQ